MSNFKSVKRWVLIVCTAAMLTCASGCVKELYHDGNSTDWITEQVQKGYLTQEQADELLKQEQGL
jgi:hypothetical protein